MKARRAEHASVAWNITKTVVWLGIFQAIALVIIPWTIMQLHWAIGDSRLGFEPPRLTAIALFAIFGVGHLVSAMMLAVMGRGTPLWCDAPRRLVTAGPYARVRNPMVVTALGQAFAVGLYGGSVLLFLYAVLGLILWSLIARRGEEKELIRYFGRPYEIYRRGVPLLVPRASMWKPVDDAPTRTLVVSDEGGFIKGRRRRTS